MDHEKTGRYIAACRKKKKMTQKDLADRLGVTNKAVSKWETGQGMPDISVLLELARVLDVPVEAILEGGRQKRKLYSRLCRSTQRPPASWNTRRKRSGPGICWKESGVSCLCWISCVWLCRSGTSLTETGIRSSIWPGGCSLS